MTVRPRIVRPAGPPDEPPSAAGSDATPRPDATAGNAGEVAGETKHDTPHGAGAPVAAGDEAADPDFDEATYLRAFPDIAEAVGRGDLPSGLAHFRSSGRAELRLEKAEYRALLAAKAEPAPPSVIVDILTVSPSGCTLMTGWSDDRFDQLTEVTLRTPAGVRHTWTELPRLIRADVERTLDVPPGHRYGFMLVAAPVAGAAAPLDPALANTPTFKFAGGGETRMRCEATIASDINLRELALAILPVGADVDPDLTMGMLDRHAGVQLAAINRLIVNGAGARRLVERFGPQRGRYRGSIITVLRGGSEQIVPRLALVGGGPGGAEYEYMVVVTHADQFEPSLRAARLAAATLGLSIALILQPDGDPAGTGEEAAADIARSDRLIFMDQSVLPRHADWALRHASLVDAGIASQTRLFGGLLYHPDGSLAHGGFYFEQETSLLPRPPDLPQRVTAVRLKARSEPAAVATRPLPRARPVVGVPAAFLSVDRAWFEALGGFTRHYCGGMFENIDLCLRSLRRGVPAWVHPLQLWYFERRSPVRPELSKGGTALNNWLLHRQWDDMIVPGLLGSDPAMLTAVPMEQPNATGAGLVSAA